MNRVLFFGDLAGTGFGTVTMDLGSELLALGHDVRFTSQNEFPNLPEPFASRTFQVNHPDGHLALASAGNITPLLNGSAWKDGWIPEACIVLGDYFAARMVVLGDEPTIEAFSGVPTFHYVPIEGVDLPPAWASLWRVAHPVAMTRFGSEEIHRIMPDLPPPPVVYHGVNTEQFRPLSPERPLYLGDQKIRDKRTAKRLFGGDPGRRWILRTDRHMPRKRYNSYIRALAPVLIERPDVMLVIHCRNYDQGGMLSDTLSKYPKAIRDRVIVTDNGGAFSRDALTALYNASDIYASNSAEGFGLTIAESLACGTPAVGVGYSAVPEVIGPAGVIVPEGGLIDNEYDHFWWAADERAFGAAVGSLLDDEAERIRLGREGPKHIRSRFTWEMAARAFSDLISGAVTKGVAA